LNGCEKAAAIQKPAIGENLGEAPLNQDLTIARFVAD